MRPLTRTASTRDYPDCWTVADWQQRAAVEAWERWLEIVQPVPFDDVLCDNWGAASFRAPGPSPRYRSYGETSPTPDPLSAVFALSVLDRVDAPLRFLRHVADRLIPGGLVVCTFAAWDATGPDVAVGHELRHRIYDRHTWRKLIQEAKQIGLRPFGGVDLRYHGDTLGDHTLATLVVTKHQEGEAYGPVF